MENLNQWTGSKKNLALPVADNFVASNPWSFYNRPLDKSSTDCRHFKRKTVY